MDEKYPIGKAQDQPFFEKPFDERVKEELVLDIKMLPGLLEQAQLNLDANQLDTPYREGGWKVNQLIHHVADSHMNAYMRFKLALTEDNPTIKTYDQDAWAHLKDSETVPVNISLTLLHALHSRWVALMNGLSQKDWEKTVFHPEHKKNLSLWDLLKIYSWHGKHHVAHITSLKDRMKW